MTGKINLILGEDEALILFDWLSRFNKEGRYEFEDQAEERVLWDIEALLEQSLVAPLKRDYSKRLEEARGRVRDQTPEGEEGA